MNFLGHLYLSGEDDEIKVGNFIGDFVKGNPYDQYGGKIARGIVLHREIDHFTDTHPMAQQSRKRLVPKYRHYSGVIIDIFYDHLLAANWKEISGSDLAEFAESSYDLMYRERKSLPEEARHMLPYMKRYNWLLNYAQLEGVHRTLSGMSRRTPFDSGMENAVEDLKADYDQYSEEFHGFIPEIRSFVEHWMNDEND